MNVSGKFQLINDINSGLTYSENHHGKFQIRDHEISTDPDPKILHFECFNNLNTICTLFL